jgi:hypothetical protein
MRYGLELIGGAPGADLEIEPRLVVSGREGRCDQRSLEATPLA